MVEDKNCVLIDQITFSREERNIVSDLSIKIQRGKVTVLMGPSGCGKTTILRLISGQLAPDKGKILFNQLNIHSLSYKELIKLRKQIGILFQNAALFTNLSVYENVAFPYREHTQLSEEVIFQLVNLKLEAVGLRGAKRLTPSQLSGGMARRVAIARALALDPVFMMYDEPFVGQDPITVAILKQLIRQLNKILNMTILLISHDVKECMELADYIYILSQGRVVGEGTTTELQNSSNPYIRQFIEGRPDGVIPFHYPAKPIAQEIFYDR